MKCVYHYTNGRHALPGILASGQLNARADVPGERPLVWFSAHLFWEPTATKPLMVAGELLKIPFEKFRADWGCVRFALPATDPRLMPWRKVCKFAGIPKRHRWAMENVGIKEGGDPAQWFALPGPLPLDTLRMERLTPSGWEPVSVAEVAQ